MDLIHLIVILVLVGIALWGVNLYLSPYMDGKILHILNIAVVIAVIIWLLRVFGVFGFVGGIHVGP